MPFDRYIPCPCGSGKKLKFCCEDLHVELEAIQKMLEGEQRLACLEYLEKALESQPDRACLLAIKALLQSELQQTEALEATLAHFEATHPGNPIAAAERAIQMAESGDPHLAVIKLQEALKIVDAQMPVRVYEAIGILGRSLLAAGNVLAARAHLLLQASIGGSEDPRAMSLLAPLVRSPEIPLLLRDEQPLVEPPEGTDHRDAIQQALRIAATGKWLEAADQLEGLAEQQQNPAVLRNLAILRGWLAQVDQATDAWKKYACLNDIPTDDAIEAEALTQLIDPNLAFDTVPLVCQTLELHDADGVAALLSANRQTEILGEPQPSPLQQEGQPSPRLVFLLLDREMPASGAGIALENLPCVLGQGYLFGRETDRSARIEFVFYQDAQSDDALERLNQVTDNSLQKTDETTLSEVPDIERKMGKQTRVPPDTPIADRERLAGEKQQEALFKIWPDLPQPVLDGKTPRAVAQAEQNSLELQAAILVLETSNNSAEDAIDFNQLRNALGVPLPEPISPESVDPERLPMVRMNRVAVAEMPDAWLLHAYRRAAMLAATNVLGRLASEVVQRESLDGQVDKAEACGLMAGVSPTSQQAVEWLHHAREWAAKEKTSPARWLLAELDLHLRGGDSAAAQRLLQEIQSQYIREPGIAQALVQLLAKYGIIDPRAAVAGGVPPGAAAASGPESVSAAPPAPEEEQKIWTPDGSASGPQKKSAIWTPDD